MASDTQLPEEMDVEESLDIPVNARRVAAIFEDIDSVPGWHPVLKKVTPTKNQGRGEGAELEWEAEVMGMTVSGTSVNSVWQPGKEFVWQSKERNTGVTWQGRVRFNEVKPDTTNTTVSLHFNIPPTVKQVMRLSGAQGVVRQNLQRVLAEAHKEAARRR